MGIEYYLFAAFVFALGTLIVWMLIKGINKGRAERDFMWEQKVKKLETMYAELNGLLEALETYVEDSKTEIARSARQATDVFQKPEPPAEMRMQAEKTEKGENMKEGGRDSLYAQAVELKRSGYSAQEIAEKFGVSSGEVNLMLRMSKRNIS